MAEDYARATGAARSFALDGVTYLVGAITPRGLGDLQAYLKEACPDPRAVARQHMAGLGDEVQKAMWAAACAEAKDWPPGVETPEGMRLLLSEAGQARLLWVACRRHTAGFTLEAARALSARRELTADETEALMGLMLPGQLGDPKVPTPAPGAAAG